ncbi:hypothetical protein [Kordia sp.]|uniref:hypothetical protein n=1 Tax=Kordia sp. TaxID=1965332 RepID=UPI0025C13235|nr:hypothetical protein [Kordia sp.]MCH2195955.1 hypothetical protein [Kordia sp.]
MIAKKYFSALIIFLVLLGYYQEQAPVPNQEIELQFSQNEVVSEETEDVILAIKEQLESLGVTNIQVRQLANNTLAIAYYSDENVAVIKEFLIEKGFASKKLPKTPTEETGSHEIFANADSYKLDIYELQTTSDSYLGTHGKYILDLQKEYDKSPTSSSFANANSFITGDFDVNSLVLTYSESDYTVTFKENISYEIPDVRAGPFTIILS